LMLWLRSSGKVVPLPGDGCIAGLPAPACGAAGLARILP
jgi:hypothetical protein